MSKSQKARGAIFRVALIGICAALLEAVKIALEPIPNVEGITLLCALFGYCFGSIGVLASVVFAAIEPLRWGIHTWVILYLIYWPSVSIAFMIFRKLKIKNIFVVTGAAVLLTVWFGIFSSLIDTFFFRFFSEYWSISKRTFWTIFTASYLNGVSFYITQIVCNAILFPLLFRPLSELMLRLRAKFLPEKSKKDLTNDQNMV